MLYIKLLNECEYNYFIKRKNNFRKNSERGELILEDFFKL